MDESNVIVSSDTRRAVRVPPGQRLARTFPVLHYGPVHRLDTTVWALHLFGLVEKERYLGYAAFVALPQVELLADIHCVTGWSMLDTHWQGVSTSALKDLVTIRPEARYVTVHGAGGFSTNLSCEDFFAEDVLLATHYEGKALTPEHGYPVRLVVPRLYFWKSAKWVTGVEFVRDDRPGFWESHGYHNHGDPWSEERYS